MITENRMNKVKGLSVIILTKNSEDEVTTALKTARFAEEIVVVDTGSEDKTLDIVRKYADVVVGSDGNDFSKWRNLGAKKASGDWLLYLDSDERIPLKLANEISEILLSGDKDAYLLTRYEIMLGKHLKHWGDSQVLRLIKKNALVKWQGKLHEQPIIEGNIGQLKHKLIHLTHKNIDEKTTSTFNWSRMEANLMLAANHPKMTWWRFYRIIFTEFIHRAFVKGLVWDGDVGHIESIYQSFSRFMSYVRLWELQQSPSLRDVYQQVDKKIMEEWNEKR